MKINQKMLNIPPYISTSWKNITALYVDSQQNKSILNITLLNGTCIQIPDLQSCVLEAVFSMHSQYLEQESQSNKEKTTLPQGFLGMIPGIEFVNSSELLEDPASLQNLTAFLKTLGTSFKGILPGIDFLLQHSSQLAETSILSKDLLEHIFSFLKSLDDSSMLNGLLSKPEHPHCNCPYCQISRFAQNKDLEELEEAVSDKDLKFKTWDIEQTGDKLFAVTNPFDANEKYSVYIGDPLGCTCGEMRCKHIHAVLSTDIA